MARLSFKKIKIEQGRQLSDPGLYPRMVIPCLYGGELLYGEFLGRLRSILFLPKVGVGNPGFHRVEHNSGEK